MPDASPSTPDASPDTPDAYSASGELAPHRQIIERRDVYRSTLTERCKSQVAPATPRFATLEFAFGEQAEPEIRVEAEHALPDELVECLRAAAGDFDLPRPRASRAGLTMYLVIDPQEIFVLRPIFGTIIEGALSRPQVKAVLQGDPTFNTDWRECTHVITKSDRRGYVMIEMQIAADGKVKQARLSESGLDWPEVEQCLVELYAGAVFPEAPGPSYVLWVQNFHGPGELDALNSYMTRRMKAAREAPSEVQ